MEMLTWLKFLPILENFRDVVCGNSGYQQKMKVFRWWLLMAAAASGGEKARVAYAFSVLEKARGNVAAAESRLVEAHEAAPQAIPLAEKIAAMKLQAGDRAGAAAVMRKMAEGSLGDFTRRLAYADFLLDHGGGDVVARRLAIEEIEACLKMKPAVPALVSRLFRASPESARRGVLEKLTGADAASALAFHSLAFVLPDADHSLRAESERRFVRAMELEPESRRLARAASDFFRERRRLPEALGVLRKHAAAAPASLELRVRLGVLCFAAGEDAEGVRELQEVLKIDPALVLAHQALAKHFRKTGDRAGVARHESERLKISGGTTQEALTLADEWLALGNPAEARLLLEKVVFQRPENIGLRMKLAVATRRDSATRHRAAELFRVVDRMMAAERAPADPGFLLEAAEAALAEGDRKAAEERLRAAIRAFPPGAEKEMAAALRGLAGIWETENRNQATAAALRKRADAIDPPVANPAAAPGSAR